MTDQGPMQPDYRRRMEAAEAKVVELERRHQQATEAATAKLDAVIAEATATYMAERQHRIDAQARAEAAEQRLARLTTYANGLDRTVAEMQNELAAAEAREQALRDRATALADHWLTIPDTAIMRDTAAVTLHALLSPPTADTDPADDNTTERT